MADEKCKLCEQDEHESNWECPEYDPTPHCAWCGAMEKKHCNCGPRAEND
jgi:hypothetical protein